MFEALLSLFLLKPVGIQNVQALDPVATKYEQVIAKLETLAHQNSQYATVITIGVNDQGTPLKALKIGDGPTASLVVATHHGNEYGSTAVAIGFAESLVKNPIPDQTVYVIPVLNVTGYNRGRREENNLNRLIDANRDYPSPCKKNQAFLLKSTQSLAQFIEDKDIQISATLHTYWPAVVYPWGISTTDTSTPYDETYKKLVAAATVESRYQTGNNTQVLYPADGTFEDYAYFKHGIWSLLFELGFSHNPDQTAIQNMVNVNIPGLRRFLETSPKMRVTEHSFRGRCDSRMPQRVFLE